MPVEVIALSDDDDDVQLSSAADWQAASKEPAAKRARLGTSPFTKPRLRSPNPNTAINGTSAPINGEKSTVSKTQSPSPRGFQTTTSSNPPRPKLCLPSEPPYNTFHRRRSASPLSGPPSKKIRLENADNSDENDTTTTSGVPLPTLPVSPENARSRAREMAFSSGIDSTRALSIQPSSNPFYFPEKRPYMPSDARQRILRGSRHFVTAKPSLFSKPTIFHVDFTTPEIRALHLLARKYYDAETESKNTPVVGLGKLLRRKNKKNKVADTSRAESLVTYLVRYVRQKPDLLPFRSPDQVEQFLLDLQRKRIPLTSSSTVFLADKDTSDSLATTKRAQRIPALLFARELYGRGFSSRGSSLNIKNELRKAREDCLELRAQWTNCAGDIHTASWVSNDGFVVGTTNHSDRHNQQYNRPGNLLLGSIADNTLRSYPDHRILRPIVDKGDNASHEMRESQDPYLYTTVCDSVYDAIHNRAYTCGYDRTVKVWRVRTAADKSRMDLIGTWVHEGNVNFVVASKSGLIATAADAARDAVRVYQVDERHISSSSFTPFSCRREDRNTNWAYCPATIKWGVAKEVEHLLLVGYSPRSLTEDPNNVPMDKVNTGEIALWDAVTGERLKINTASNANVFDVAWHPRHAVFFVGTSPCGQFDDGVKTQIYIYAPADTTIDPTVTAGSYSVIKTLDCTASDINEIIIRPNSFAYSYVAAGCTDGNVYIWDTAPCDEDSDKPIYVLPHDKPVETLMYAENREDEDIGIKFMAWGKTPDRFYTGSSDGVVKVWSIRSDRDPHLWNILEVPGAITYGAFSPDFSRLLIGDATGRVSLLSVHEEDEVSNSFFKIGGRKIRRPQLAIPHEEPPRPDLDAQEKPVDDSSGPDRAHAWLQSGALRITRVGAVQGPNYSKVIGLYEKVSHLDMEPSKHLLGQIQRLQQEERGDIMYPDLKKLGLECQKRRHVPSAPGENRELEDLGSQLGVLSLDQETKSMLEAEGAILDPEEFLVGDQLPEEFEYEEGVSTGYWGGDAAEGGEEDET